jgi:NADH dehydrogenase [ubiquinone] 1 alpha subcomplex assembly factor 6
VSAPDALSYCAAAVRRHDPDRYLCAVFAPPDRREDLLALYAFNLEIARTREAVSEAMLGRIRLQWWREAVEGIFAGAPRRHAVVAALAAAVARRGLDRAGLDALIDAREADLDGTQPPDLAAMESYAEATAGALAGIAADILGAGDAARGAARHAGTAWALVGLLRAVRFHARGRRLYLPADLMAAHGVDAGAVFALRSSAGLAAVARAVAAAARRRIDAARALAPRVPRSALPVLLQARLAEVCLARLRRRGFDVLAPDAGQRPPLAAWAVALAALAGRY